jgi:hypothetical protein
MKMAKRRPNRQVSFRLTEDEIKRLDQIAVDLGGVNRVTALKKLISSANGELKKKRITVLEPQVHLFADGLNVQLFADEQFVGPLISDI